MNEALDLLQAMDTRTRCALRAIEGTAKVPRLNSKKDPLTGKRSRRGVSGAFGGTNRTTLFVGPSIPSQQ